MGRPRGGKGKNSMEPAKSQDAAGSGGEEVIPAYKRRGRPQKLLKGNLLDEEEDIAKAAEEDGDGAIAKAAPSKGVSAENGGKKRRRQWKRGSDSAIETKDEPVTPPPNGFRQNGSRRKSTPRRAAEAGVES